MNRTRVILFASVVAAAMVFGGVVGATALAQSSLVQAFAAPLAATSPSPSPQSNESTAHEAGESAAQETVENNGTFRPGGAGAGHACGGHSNEDAAHEKTETAAQEAAENAACPSPSASPSATR